MNITTIIGTRPNYIKLAMVSKKLREKYNETIIDTGQHYDYNMSDVFYNELDIPKADYNLDVGSGSPLYQVGQIISRVDGVLDRVSSDVIMVYGDTNSTLAGAIAGIKKDIPVIHIEAGLRSFDISMPEEVNRVIVDHISTVLCCPTINALENLKREGIDSTSGWGWQHPFFTGDVMMDMINKYIDIATKKSKILDYYTLNAGEYYVATIHRQSNISELNLPSILNTFKKVDELIVFPMHPRTYEYISSYGLSIPENVLVVDPVGYFDMITLVKYARKVFTDSGGLQKEAYIIGTPCITLRDSTEWVETTEGFWNILVGNDPKLFLSALQINSNKERANLTNFGDGFATDKIVKVIENIYG